jgi:hypothetical protein
MRMRLRLLTQHKLTSFCVTFGGRQFWNGLDNKHTICILAHKVPKAWKHDKHLISDNLFSFFLKNLLQLLDSDPPINYITATISEKFTNTVYESWLRDWLCSHVPQHMNMVTPIATINMCQYPTTITSRLYTRIKNADILYV